MKLEIVTIKDAKSREFNRPAFESSVESALRSFGVLCSEDPARSLLPCILQILICGTLVLLILLLGSSKFCLRLSTLPMVLMSRLMRSRCLDEFQYTL